MSDGDFFRASNHGDKDSLTDAYQQVAIVYSSIMARARSLAQCRLKVCVTNQDGEKEEVHNSPLESLINRPNPLASRAQLTELWEVSICRTGKFFALLEREKETAVPTAVWPLPAGRVKPVLGKNGLPVQWKYTPGGGKPSQTLETWQVLYDRLPHPTSVWDGMSPLAAAKMDIEQEWSVSVWNNAFISNGCDPGGRYELKEGAALSPEQAKSILRHHEDRYKGPSNTNAPQVDMGGLKWAKNDIPHRDMSFEKQKEFNLQAVKMVLGVPDALLGISKDQNYNTSKNMIRSFWHNTLLPRVDAMEEVLWTQLTWNIDGGKYEVLFATEEVEALQDDVTERIDAVTKLWTASVPMQEAARLLDIPMEEYEDWDLSYVSGGVFPSGEGPVPASAATSEAKSAVVFEDITRAQYASAKAWDDKVVEPNRKKYYDKIKRWFYEYRDATLKLFAEETKASKSEMVNKNENTDPASEFDPEDILPPQDEFVDRLSKYVGGIYESSILEAAALQAGRIGTETQITALRGQIADFFDDECLGMVTKISDTLRDQLKDSMIEGMKAGETAYDLAGRIKHIHKKAQNRSMTIARTEVGRAASFGAMAESEESGVVKGNTWNSALDKATRTTHRLLHGQYRDLGKAFVTTNGDNLLFPHDPNASGGETINCRCVLDPVLFDDDEE
ncbi:MAG: phage portal protein [Planctomycetota bacterium]|nr:phage portal protein [Planctomycetota bacterium]